MTNHNEIIRDLGIRLVRAEINARRPKDAKAVEDAIATRIRIGNDGNVFVVDKSGQRDDAKSFEQFMDEVASDRPELFQGRPNTTGRDSPSSTKGNPFLKSSPDYNLSEGMKLYQSDPENAKALAFAAGVALN